MGTNKNNSTAPNLWDAVKALQKGKYIANTGLPQERKKKSQKNSLNSQLMKLGKERMRPKVDEGT